MNHLSSSGSNPAWLVYFAIRGFTTGVEELDEQTLARRIENDADFVGSLSEQEGIEGALVIGDGSILDDQLLDAASMLRSRRTARGAGNHLRIPVLHVERARDARIVGCHDRAVGRVPSG